MLSVRFLGNVVDGDEVVRAREIDFCWWRFGGGITFYPYQIAFGLTLRYWPCIFAPAIRIHVGPFKAWAYVAFKKRTDQSRDAQ